MLHKSKENNNAATSIELLWQEGFFKVEHSLKEVSRRIAERWGHNFLPSETSNALKNAKFLIRTGRRGFFQYKHKISPVNKKVEHIEDQLFSDDLIEKLGNDFKYEIEDLKLNFGKSGNCTAFLLRKILEKLIYIAFAKHNLVSKLEDKSQARRLVGLSGMINAASLEKIKGVPFLVSKTAKEIQGIKFLGDTSAHNPLTEVDMKTIIPQMPYIITAYKELAKKL